MNNIKESPAGNGCIRVLGVDPAAAGPTGYGIVESDGQCCRALHYGALKSVSKQQRGWSGAALQGVHALIYGLIEEYAADALAVALCHLRAEQVRRRFGLPRKNDGTKLRSVSAAAASASATTGIRTSGTTRGGLPRIVSTR